MKLNANREQQQSGKTVVSFENAWRFLWRHYAIHFVTFKVLHKNSTCKNSIRFSSVFTSKIQTVQRPLNKKRGMKKVSRKCGFEEVFENGTTESNYTNGRQTVQHWPFESEIRKVSNRSRNENLSKSQQSYRLRIELSAITYHNQQTILIATTFHYTTQP